MEAAAGLRLLVFDRTCTRDLFGRVGLSTAWAAGDALYRALGRVDAAQGVATWDEALAWLASVRRDEPLAEVQYWGHGRWGRVHVAADVLDARSIGPGGRHADGVRALRERFVPDGRGLLWLRTCEAFGARAGLDFAARLADATAARVAGHTHVIGVLQSGLRGVAPGCAPDWSADEGLAEGVADAPVRARGSSLRAPRTVSCLHGAVPRGWITGDVDRAPSPGRRRTSADQGA